MTLRVSRLYSEINRSETMTPNFVEELFLRIEERLISLEIEMREMKSEIAILHKDVSRISEFSSELESIRRIRRFTKGLLLTIWGFLVTAVNVLINRLMRLF